MKDNTVVRGSAAFVYCLFGLIAQAIAQSEPTIEPDPFPAIKDAQIHAALEALGNISTPDPIYLNDRATLQGYAAQFREKKVFDAANLILQKVASKELDPNISVAVHATIVDAISGMIATGAPEVLPVLKRLANDNNRWIRKEIISSQVSCETHSYELMLESIKAAESRLPNDILDEKNAQEAFNELESSIGNFCSYTKPDQRGPARETIDRFLNRYSDQSVRTFYEDRLKKYLQADFPERVLSSNPTKGGTTTQQDRTAQASKVSKQNSSPIENESSLKKWIIWLLVSIIVTSGAVWLLRKRLK